jgi:hypothetical protein
MFNVYSDGRFVGQMTLAQAEAYFNAHPFHDVRLVKAWA